MYYYGGYRCRESLKINDSIASVATPVSMVATAFASNERGKHNLSAKLAIYITAASTGLLAETGPHEFQQ